MGETAALPGRRKYLKAWLSVNEIYSVLAPAIVVVAVEVVVIVLMHSLHLMSANVVS